MPLSNVPLKQKKLILINSCVDNERKRTACQSTWLSRLPETCTVRFVIGNNLPDSDQYLDTGTTLYVPAVDTTPFLRNKVQKAFSWVAKNRHRLGIDYVFKCDDDTFLLPSRFARFDPVYPYVGQDNTTFAVDSTADISCPFALGGAGYFVRQDFVEYVADNILSVDIASLGYKQAAEDVSVGYIMAKIGYPVVHCSLLSHGNVPCPLPSNNLITAHHVQPDYMLHLWNANINPDPPSPGPQL